jgi:hypothetical protein
MARYYLGDYFLADWVEWRAGPGQVPILIAQENSLGSQEDSGI